jgi:hypothetical protein
MKKDLAKAALAALMISASLPAIAQAEQNSQEVFLAMAGCGATEPRKEIADNSSDKNLYDARTNSYQMNSNNNYGNSSANPAPVTSEATNRMNSEWNTASGTKEAGNANRQSSETPSSKTGSFNEKDNPVSSQAGIQNSSASPSYNTAGDKNYSRSSSSNTMSEDQLVNSLNRETRAIYNNLNLQGKALALQLASQDNYADKNLAVKEAQRRTSGTATR